MERLGLPFHDFLFGFQYPAVAYGHHLGIAVTGGFVYREPTMPQLQGMYTFGDIASGRIFFAEASVLTNGTQAPFYEVPLHYQGSPSAAMLGTLRLNPFVNICNARVISVQFRLFAEPYLRV